MARTVISLDPADKAWLDQKAKREQLPMTEVVRRAIRKARDEDEARERRATFEELLEQTFGTWRNGDGLEYQIRIRKEWDREWDQGRE